MSRIVLSTTSSCLERLKVLHKLEFIRFTVTVNNVDFIDGKNITGERLADLMLATPATPTSTAPTNIDDILAKFQELEQRGYTDAYIVTISSMISKTYENVLAAQALYKGSLNIFVYDSKAATIMEGALAFEADKLLQQGKSFAEITQRLDEIRQNSSFLFTVADLDYLITNKKISTPAGFFANLFDLKPVIEMTQTGELIPIKKIRKIEKSLEFIADYFKEIQQQGAYIYIISAGDSTLTERFSQLLAKDYGLSNLPVLLTSTITLANHGPNAVGLGYFLGERPLLTQYL